jgi:hypothetical protein
MALGKPVLHGGLNMLDWIALLLAIPALVLRIIVIRSKLLGNPEGIKTET